MTHITSSLAAILAAALLAGSQAASAIGSNVTGAGGFASGVTTHTGSRERVVLATDGGLLVGEPKHEVIRLIAVDAPGHDESHLLLRDLVSADGTRTLRLTTPESLTALTRNVTLFVKHESKNLVLVHLHDGVWRSEQPSPIAPPRTVAKEGSGNDLRAFRVAGPGSYWLLEGDSVPEFLRSSPMPDTPAGNSLSGGIFGALVPLFLSVLLLAFGWAISTFIHWTQRSKGK